MGQELLAKNNEVTRTQSSNSISFYCTTILSDEEQIILKAEKLNGNWVNGAYVVTPTGEQQDYRLEEIIYRGYGDEPARIDGLVVRGFRKDGGLKFRTTQLYGKSPLSDRLIPQIPDHYHSHARAEFDKHMKLLQEQLTNLTNKGLEIGK
jgi:hypothetical protein